MRKLLRFIPAAAGGLAIAAAPAAAQSHDFRWEKALPAGDHVSVSNINGDITVKPSTSGKVEVVGITRRDDNNIRSYVQETSRGVRVCILVEDDEDCDDRSDRHRSWHGRVDLEVAIPANLTVSAGNVSGDVTITGAQGDVEASDVSGDVHLDHLHASAIRASTVSGDIRVNVDALDGDGPLSFHTVSGDAYAELPRGLNADFSMSTVSGRLESPDFPVTIGGRWSRRSMDAKIGNGGRRLEFSSVSGNLTLRATK